MNERRVNLDQPQNGHDKSRKGDQLKHACGLIVDLSFKNMIRFEEVFDSTDSALPTSERLLEAAEKLLAE